jgi:hypothetical protein
LSSALSAFTISMTRLATLLAALTLGAACASTAPSGPLEPLVAGWEHHATIEYQAAPHGDRTVVWGYLQTSSPYTFHRIRVLVDALDAQSQLVAQQVAWVPGNLGWPTRLYFEVAMPPAPAYRVRVFSWDRLESDRGRGRWW